jgi:multidrug efflux pump subunit AcrB
MNLPQASIRRPVTVLMVTLIAILLGVISFARLPST